MIASRALFAIWRPKLEDTFLTPNASASTDFFRSVVSSAVSCGRERLGADLEALVVRRSSTSRGPG